MRFEMPEGQLAIRHLVKMPHWEKRDVHLIQQPVLDKMVKSQSQSLKSKGQVGVGIKEVR